MVINMIQKDGAEESNPRVRQESLTIFRQGPWSRQASIVHLAHRILGDRETFGESVEDFLAALGLRLGEGWCLHGVHSGQRGDVALRGSNVQSQLPQGIGFRMRPP